MSVSTARAPARARVRQDKTRILDTGSSKLRQNETRQHTKSQYKTRYDYTIDKAKQIMARQKTRQEKTKQIMEDKTKQGKTRQRQD